jgi:hypothetical protein
MTIGLDEALEGVTRTIRHLNGKSLTLSSPPDRVIQSGDVHVLKGHGMPKNAQGTDFGDLYLQYEVKLPRTNAALNRLTREERHELSRLIRKLEGRTLPASSNTTSKDVQYLEPARVSDFGIASGRPELPRDDHEDEEPHVRGNPFASAFGQGQSFFYSSSRSGTNTGSSSFFGMNPEDLFRGSPQPDDYEYNECNQM